jgi:UPF0716 family protein affecting phage T7 exclusion
MKITDYVRITAAIILLLVMGFVDDFITRIVIPGFAAQHMFDNSAVGAYSTSLSTLLVLVNGFIVLVAVLLIAPLVVRWFESDKKASKKAKKKKETVSEH